MTVYYKKWLFLPQGSEDILSVHCLSIYFLLLAQITLGAGLNFHSWYMRIRSSSNFFKPRSSSHCDTIWDHQRRKLKAILQIADPYDFE